jgi:transcriptional regulator with XRE-family HTH domain
MKQPSGNLSDNLQESREDRKLRVDGLADLTGVSDSMLRQIEIGQSSPTIATIWRIADGLRIPFSTLLREPG